MKVELGFSKQCPKCGHTVGLLIGDQKCPNCGSPMGAMPEHKAPTITTNAVCPKCGHTTGLLFGDPVCSNCGERLPDPE